MRTPIFAGLAILAAAGLSACSEKTQDNLEQTGDSIGNDMSRAADDAGAAIDNGLDDAGQAIDSGADRVGAAADEAASMPVALFETVPLLNRYLDDHGIRLDYAGLVSQIRSPDVKGIMGSLIGEGAIPPELYKQALEKHRPRLREIFRNYFADQKLICRPSEAIQPQVQPAKTEGPLASQTARNCFTKSACSGPVRVPRQTAPRTAINRTPTAARIGWCWP